MASYQNCGLIIFQWNCSGLLAHLVKQHLAYNQYDVLCLQETFFKPSKAFILAGCSIIRK